MIENNIPVSVLIVDDNPAMLAALVAALESMDIGIVTATSGEEALRKLVAQDFAAVLLDINMPDMDGFEAAKTIRHLQKSEHLPILFVTAERLTNGDRLQGYEFGAVDYILSPILPQILRSKVAVFADLYRLREQIARQNQVLEKKVAEFRESEARYRRITEGLTDYLYAVHIENGRAVETTQSPACVTVTGYTAEEFATDPYLWLDMVVPEDRERVLEHVRQIMAGQDVMPIEHRITRKDGEMRWVSDTTVLFKDATGKLLSYDGVIKDITERKQAARALAEAQVIAESEEKFRKVTESAQDAIIMMGADKCISLWNPAAERIFGHTGKEALGKEMHALLAPPEAQTPFEQGFQHFLQTGTGPVIGKKLELTALRKGRVPFPVEVTISALQINGLWNAIGIFRDITERKLTEAKIQRLTEFYNTSSQCSHAIVNCTTEEELFTQVCRTAVQAGGIKMAWIGLVDETGKQVVPVVAYGEGKEYLQGIQISVEAGSPFGRGPSGTCIRENRPFWCMDFMHDPCTAPWHERGARYGWGTSAALPLRRKGVAIGTLSLYAGEVNDFDDALRNLLLEMAADISHALDNFAREAERKQAEQKLRASLAEKEVLMREIHHRVKNNMQMMSALLELQSGYVKDEQALGFFKDSQQRIQSMAMIHEQLYHNKNLAKIDFAAYLRSLVDALRGQYSERCKQVNIRIDASACTLPVDIAIPCGLVVCELVSNVFKHAFPNGRTGELRIGLQCGDGKVVLEVADDGVGLPAGLDSQHSKSFGLQVVRLMVEKQLHGKLSVESSGQSAARSLSPDSLPRGERESCSLRENLFNHGTRVVCEIGGEK